MHLWIILDGNRRWAKLQGKPSFYWHQVGFKNVENILEKIHKKWIEYVTLWALSKENLEKRDIDEVNGLIKLIDSFSDFLPNFQKNNIKFETIWDIGRLPEKTQKILQNMKDATRENTAMIVIIALVYSGQDEIVRATKKIIQSGVSPEDIDEKVFRKYLDTARFPEVDLIIRTGGDSRHSWFVLYDSAYSEYYFTQKFWPEFDEEELDRALYQYNTSERRFWK